MGLNIVGKNVFELEKEAFMNLKTKMAEGEGNTNKNLMHQDKADNARNFLWMKNHIINEEIEGEQESKQAVLAQHVGEWRK